MPKQSRAPKVYKLVAVHVTQGPAAGTTYYRRQLVNVEQVPEVKRVLKKVLKPLKRISDSAKGLKEYLRTTTYWSAKEKTFDTWAKRVGEVVWACLSSIPKELLPYGFAVLGKALGTREIYGVLEEVSEDPRMFFWSMADMLRRVKEHMGEEYSIMGEKALGDVCLNLAKHAVSYASRLHGKPREDLAKYFSVLGTMYYTTAFFKTLKTLAEKGDAKGVKEIITGMVEEIEEILTPKERLVAIGSKERGNVHLISPFFFVERKYSQPDYWISFYRMLERWYRKTKGKSFDLENPEAIRKHLMTLMEEDSPQCLSYSGLLGALTEDPNAIREALKIVVRQIGKNVIGVRRTGKDIPLSDKYLYRGEIARRVEHHMSNQEKDSLWVRFARRYNESISFFGAEWYHAMWREIDDFLDMPRRGKSA